MVAANMVLSSPPSWLPQAEFDEFNDITYDKIKSYTSIPKLKRLERYMREEGFTQTAEVARQRIIAQGGKDLLCPEPGLWSSEDDVVIQNMQCWQEDIKGKDAELQKLLNLKSTRILNGACDDLSNPRSCFPEVRKISPQVPELDSSSKEEKAEKLPRKDIRSGREYYDGWDKYVSYWEKAKEYNSSLQAYTKAISMYKDNAALYANRAAVYLQMNRYEEAYADCTKTLKLDPQNVKMFMSLCPGDGSVEKLIEELESKVDKQNLVNGAREPVAIPCAPPSNSVRVKKLNPKKKVSEALQNPDKRRTANIPGTPKSALEFERSCLDLLKQPLALKEYIQAIKINLYPIIFKDNLNARILKLVAVFLKGNNTLFESKEMYDILQGFTRVRRFEIVVMFLEPCSKGVLKQVLDHLAATPDLGKEDVYCLSRKYLCT